MPTASLLWAVSQVTLAPDDVAAAVEAGADLPRAADVALVQRVSPLLWRALTKSGVPVDMDADWAKMTSDDAARCRAQALLVLPRLGTTALQPLSEAGLTPLVFKGAVLARRYPEPGLRPMDDVDLVLPPEQLRRAVDALERAGWRVVPVPADRHHEVTLVHDAVPGLPVELHHALATWRTRSNRLSMRDLWQWRRADTLLGSPVFTLAAEEELVALVAHAAKPFHVFDRLIWSVDVAVVITESERAGHPVDWERVGYLAEVTGCRTALAVGLTQAARLGAESPSALRRLSARGSRARALLPVLSEEWPLVEREWSTKTRLRYALVDDWRQRVTLLASQIIEEEGVSGAPRTAVALGARGTRRWWKLRREAASMQSTGS